MIAVGIVSFFTVPSIVRNHYFSLAIEQDSLKNKDMALQLYKKSAEWDHAEGAFKAGEILCNKCLEITDSIRLNEAKSLLTDAISLFDKSSALGYKEANYMLGYTISLSMPKDTAKIFPPLRKDCGTKDADAKYFLGNLYSSLGKIDKAIFYIDKAAKSLGSANNSLYKLYSNPSLVSANLDKANQYLIRGAELGDPELQSILGHNYLNGTNGFNRDSEKGFTLLQESIKNGGQNAYTSLGWCYMNSVGTAQNFDEAVKWIKKGEENGDPNAKYLLGICYGNGYGVIKDEQRAIQLITQAASEGCTDAKTALAQLKRQTRPVAVSRPQKKYQPQKEVRCDVCGGTGYRHGVNMNLPKVGRDNWGQDIYRCDYCGGRGYTMQ